MSSLGGLGNPKGASSIASQLKDAPVVTLRASMGWQALLTGAASNAHDNLRQQDLDVILDKLKGKDGVIDQADLAALKAAIDALKAKGGTNIAPETLDGYFGQILGEVSYRVREGDSKLLAQDTDLNAYDANVARWENFADRAHNAAAVREQMVAALEDRQLSVDELRGLITQAGSNDGQTTLWEIRAMYRGIDQAHKAGKISDEERRMMYAQLDEFLTLESKSKNQNFSSNAQLFIRMYLGGTTDASTGDTNFDHPMRARQLARSLAADGNVSDEDVQVIMAALTRDGKATVDEIKAVGHALAKAVKKGVLSQEEYDSAINRLNDAMREHVHGGIEQAGFDVFGRGRVDRSDEIRAAAAAAAAGTSLSTAQLDTLFGPLASDGSITINEIHAVYDGIADAVNQGKVSKNNLPALYGSLDSYLQLQLNNQNGPWTAGLHNDLTPEAARFVRDRVGANMSVSDVDALLERVQRGKHATNLEPGKGPGGAFVHPPANAGGAQSV